jgi:hypothetical protein
VTKLLHRSKTADISKEENSNNNKEENSKKSSTARNRQIRSGLRKNNKLLYHNSVILK